MIGLRVVRGIGETGLEHTDVYRQRAGHIWLSCRTINFDSRRARRRSASRIGRCGAVCATGVC